MGHIIKIEDDGFITIPPEIIKQLKWTPGTVIDAFIDNGNIVLKERTNWTLPDFQENLEGILDRIQITQKTHYLLVDGKTFCVVPYSKELANIIDSKPSEIKSDEDDIEKVLDDLSDQIETDQDVIFMSNHQPDLKKSQEECVFDNDDHFYNRND